MSQIYNTQAIFTSNFKDFFKDFPLSKPQLNSLASLILGLADSESVVSDDIVRKLAGFFGKIKEESATRRIRRFLNNDHLDIYSIYDQFIHHVIHNFNFKHPDSRAHIAVDHMFCNDKFTVLMFSLRIGKQGIPLWFRCFQDNDDPQAFEESLLEKGVKYVYDLFDGKNAKLIFLGDRWFGSFSLMDYISSLGGSFCFRLKSNVKIKIYDKKERHMVWKTIGDLVPYAYHSTIYHDILFCRRQVTFSLAVSKGKKEDDLWYIVTNQDPERAIKDYAYRFGAIETFSKNLKIRNLMDSVWNQQKQKI